MREIIATVQFCMCRALWPVNMSTVRVDGIAAHEFVSSRVAVSSECTLKIDERDWCTRRKGRVNECSASIFRNTLLRGIYFRSDCILASALCPAEKRVTLVSRFAVSFPVSHYSVCVRSVS